MSLSDSHGKTKLIQLILTDPQIRQNHEQFACSKYCIVTVTKETHLFLYGPKS